MSSFEALKNAEIYFYGIDSNHFKLGRYVFVAVENPDDGYRSFLEAVEKSEPTGLIFFKKPLAKVRVVEENITGVFTGYRLVDVKDNHTWLRFGTDNYDDYYPMFIFDYEPKKIP